MLLKSEQRKETDFSVQEATYFLKVLGIDISEINLPSNSREGFDLWFNHLNVNYDKKNKEVRITGEYFYRNFNGNKEPPVKKQIDITRRLE